MNPLTREERLAAFAQLEKLPGIKRASVYADEIAGNLAVLNFDHPHGGGKVWKVIGMESALGFYRLESSVPIGLDFKQERFDYQRFELLLSADQFTRVQ